jgi:hypothetical protein
MKVSDNSVNQTVGALRFFFVKTLKRPWRADETPYPKKRMRLPVILSRDEVARLIESDGRFKLTPNLVLTAQAVRSQTHGFGFHKVFGSDYLANLAYSSLHVSASTKFWIAVRTSIPISGTSRAWTSGRSRRTLLTNGFLSVSLSRWDRSLT